MANKSAFVRHNFIWYWEYAERNISYLVLTYSTSNLPLGGIWELHYLMWKCLFNCSSGCIMKCCVFRPCSRCAFVLLRRTMHNKLRARGFMLWHSYDHRTLQISGHYLLNGTISWLTMSLPALCRAMNDISPLHEPSLTAFFYTASHQNIISCHLLGSWKCPLGPWRP